MNSDLEEIKSRLNIVDVLGEYIRLQKAGSSWRALCPFHNEKSPSFMVSEEKQIWHCFGCQKGGDIFGFVMEMEGLEFRDVLKLLAEKAGVKLSGFNSQKAEEKNRTIEILELATKWYSHQLWEGPGKTKILAYLKERGLKDDTIKEFRLGYAPRGWRNILSFLLSRGFKIEEIVKTGLLVQKTRSSEQETGNTNNKKNADHWSLSPDHYYDRFRERIMFPVADYSGKILGFSARVAPGGDESQAKYINTPETQVYHKSRILYGIDKARNEIKKENSALLVEGNMDVIAANQAGAKNAVAVSGTALTPEQIKIIKRYTPNVKMFFDMDEAGEIATKKSIKLCFSEDVNVEVVTLSSGKDAAELARDDPEKLKKAIKSSRPAMEHIFSRNLVRYDKSKIADKRKISEILIEMIGSLANSIEKNHWIKKLSQELEISETTLTDMLKNTNLRDRIGKSEGKDIHEKSELIQREKTETLTCELIALTLCSPLIWKEAEKEKKTFASLRDRLLNLILEKGSELEYSFEKLNNFLENQEDKNRLDNLYFKKRYRLNLNNSLEELEIEKPLEEFSRIRKEILRELKKKELEKIAKDLKTAEEARDKKAIKILQLEFKKISGELNNLQ